MEKRLDLADERAKRRGDDPGVGMFFPLFFITLKPGVE